MSRDKKKEKNVRFFFFLKKKRNHIYIIRAFKEEAIEYSEHKTTRTKAVMSSSAAACYVCSGSEDESAKEADGGERFVGFDRE